MLKVIVVFSSLCIFNIESFCSKPNGTGRNISICINPEKHNDSVIVDYNLSKQIMGSNSTVWFPNSDIKTVKLTCSSDLPVQWNIRLSKLGAQLNISKSYLYEPSLQNGRLENYAAILTLERDDNITGLYTCSQFTLETQVENPNKLYSYYGESKVYLYGGHGGEGNPRLLNEGKTFVYPYLYNFTSMKNNLGFKNLFTLFGHGVLTSYPTDTLFFTNDLPHSSKVFEISVNVSDPWTEPKFEEILNKRLTLTWVKVRKSEQNSVSLSIIGDRAPEIELITPRNSAGVLNLADKENVSFSCQSHINNSLEIGILNKPKYIRNYTMPLFQNDGVQQRKIIVQMDGTLYNKSEILTIQCFNPNNTEGNKSWAYDVYYNSQSLENSNGNQAECARSSVYSIEYHFVKNSEEIRSNETNGRVRIVKFGNLSNSRKKMNCEQTVEYNNALIYPESNNMTIHPIHPESSQNTIIIKPWSGLKKIIYKQHDRIILTCQSSKIMSASPFVWKIQFTNKTIVDVTETSLFPIIEDISDNLNYKSKLAVALSSDQISGILCSAQIFYQARKMEIFRIGLPYYIQTKVKLFRKTDNFEVYPITIETTMDPTLAISLTIFCVILIVTMILLAYTFWTRRKIRAVIRFTREEIECFQKGNCCDTFTNLEEINVGPYNFKDYEIPRHHIFVDYTKPLGSGEFGTVVEAILSEKKKNNNSKIKVAVKMPKRSDSKDAIIAMLAELKVMIHANGHPNVVKLIGAYTKKLRRGKLFMIVELCKYGSLENYIKENRHLFYDELVQNGHTENYINSVSTGPYVTIHTVAEENNDLLHIQDLFIWVTQIASAMEYLHDKRIIHRDLSTRNILVKSKDLIKVTDFGLSKKLLKYNFYNDGGSRIAWQWQPPEAITLRHFSFKSDVWSFGVTIWEIFTLGEIPWAACRGGQEMLDLLEEGRVLIQPRYAPLKLYQLMLDTWKPEPKHRPSFEEIVEFLSYETISQMIPRSNVSNIFSDD